MKRDEYKMTQQVDTTDYKQKYEQALERAKKGECIENIFPELRESEDEKWRKWLIGHLKGYINQTDDKYAEVCKKTIAWLEKQGEQKPAEWDILSAKKGDMLSDGNIVLIVDSIEEFEGRPIINSWYFADSKKFYGKGTSECDRWEVDGFRTATEAECNYLLKMMSDAGYVWNTNKLELMEIEQNPSWSEEDEKMFDEVCSSIKYAEKHRITCPEKLAKLQLDWLKSIKPNHWKPSEEQLRAIINSAQGLYQCKEKEVLLDLYEQLKKL